MEFHPAANLFPLLDGAAFEELVSDIKANGQKEAIKLHGGKILDGRNRYRACKELGLEPRVEELPADQDPYAVVASAALQGRKPPSESQRGLAAGRAANIARHSNQFQRKLVTSIDATTLPPISVARAAELFHVSRTQVTRGRKVANACLPEVQALVEHGKMSLSTAYRIAALSSGQELKGANGMKPRRPKGRGAEGRKGRKYVGSDEVATIRGAANTLLSRLLNSTGWVEETRTWDIPKRLQFSAELEEISRELARISLRVRQG